MVRMIQFIWAGESSLKGEYCGEKDPVVKVMETAMWRP